MLHGRHDVKIELKRYNYVSNHLNESPNSNIRAFLINVYQYLITLLLCINCGQKKSYLPVKPNACFKLITACGVSSQNANFCH